MKMFKDSRIRRGLLLLPTLLLCALMPRAYADPFETCPSKAFLIQHTIATLYGVNLATGYYSELSSDLGTSGKINALAFNFHDNYLYGWGYEYAAPIRIDSNFKASPLVVDNLPDTDFYVGDIAVDKNIYYVYRSGADYGLYAIDLAPAGNGKMRATRIVDGASLKLTIFDLAFHPYNSLAYSVDRSGVLYEIDVSTGTSKILSNVGASGTFGAVYFDVDGYLYISRNSDGHVFRIDVSQSDPGAEFYAYGPSSSNNDGARCALAPLVAASDTNIDFGDAPASYGTTLSENGARHDIGAGTLFLGSQVDGESDAYFFPLSDDEADSIDDEDGVQFVTGLELGEDAILVVDSSGAAHLNAWIDWDQNGVFEAHERAIHKLPVSAGRNKLAISVPFWASAGDTWARFRLSTTAEVGPTGGVGDGEVEDYKVGITAAGVTETYYPADNSWATLAYEDNWPLQGDYDMNDLVVHLRTNTISRDGQVLGTEISGELVAVGGDYHNGFAVRLPGVDAAAVRTDNMQFWINDRLQSVSPLEAGQDEAIFIIADDTWKFVSPGEGCRFHRTEAGCESAIQMRFMLRVSFLEGLPSTTMPPAPYDPFLFATPGYEHGYLFAEPPGRALEIHLPGASPSAAFNPAFLKLGDDASSVERGEYFRNASGMPWALHIGNEWQYPLEYTDITVAYPQFELFVTSAGTSNASWYLAENASVQHVFKSQGQ